LGFQAGRRRTGCLEKILRGVSERKLQNLEKVFENSGTSGDF